MKIKTLNEIINIVEKERINGKIIVFANGIFDILHVGHIRYLKGAKELGDTLIVAINDDDSTRRIKGEGRPFTPIDERMEIISSLYFVDYVIKFGEDRVDRLLLAIKPDIMVKGGDYTVENIPERGTVLSYGGRLAIAGDPKNHSSTEKIYKIKRRRNEFQGI
jgi:rfaE bifunctional protein nucleotidyltransferase chain/domain